MRQTHAVHSSLRRWLSVLPLACLGCAYLVQVVEPGSARSRAAAAPDSPSPLTAYLERRTQPADSTAAPRPWVAVLPLSDESGFRKDVWDLPDALAGFLSTEMASSAAWRVVPYEAVAEGAGKRRDWTPVEAVAVGRSLQADVVVLGRILEFNMGRFTVGDPLLGGYKSYTGSVRLDLQALRVADGSEVGVLSADQQVVDRDLGLDLLGKPRRQDAEFTGLRDLAFGSEPFRQTVLGKAAVAAAGEVTEGLTVALKPRIHGLEDAPAEVLSAEGADVYLSLGTERGARAGDRFAVVPGPARTEPGPGVRLAVIEVQEVIGARLSRAHVVTASGQVRAGDRVELLSP